MVLIKLNKMGSETMSTMTNDMTDQCYEQALAYRQTLEEVWEAVDTDAQYEEQDPLEYLDEMPLEIVWELGEPFAVVFGTGGPHTELVGGGRQGGYYITTYWGGKQSSVSGAAITRTGEYFRELAES